MKKRVVMISLLALIIAFSLIIPTAPVFAGATSKYDVTSEIDKIGGVAQESEVTIYFSLDNFKDFNITNTLGGVTSQNGVNSLHAFIEYDEDIFYPIGSDPVTGDITMKTSNGDPVIKALGGWGAPTYNPDYNGDGTNLKNFVTERSNFINTKHQFLQITLRVKATATTGNTKVYLYDITASDQVNDLAPANVKTLPNGKQGIETPPITIIPGATPPAIDGGDGKLYLRIMPDMTVAQFKKFPFYNGCSNFKNANSTNLADTDVIPTGSTTTSGTETYTIIAVGDVNADGKLTVTDLSQLKGYFTGLITTLTDHQKRACDISWDGKSSALDLSRMRGGIVKLWDFDVATWKGTGEAKVLPIAPPI